MGSSLLWEFVRGGESSHSSLWWGFVLGGESSFMAGVVLVGSCRDYALVHSDSVFYLDEEYF